jgi:outer membrane receptor protein involved in Fe transport
VLVNFALVAAAVSLQDVAITEADVIRVTSEAGLLATQKAAPAVTDGISAEAISRSPDSDAADAITRVTGVSVVDDKFVVVRGLAERYSNTQLNGVELASPEPLKKVVPLDIFPASLLESIITTKTATPDKPGDFAGGSVEIRTKEFPENRVLQFNLSQAYNSLSTFREFPFLTRSGAEFFGYDDGSRAMPVPPPPGSEATDTDIERFAESLRNVWTPPDGRALPNVGLGINLGDKLGDENPVGYAISLSYSAKREFTPDRLYRFVSNIEGDADRGFVGRESQSAIDWGGIFNISARRGINHKFGWKNIYTRNAEETFVQNRAFETYRGPEELRIYQARYVTRELAQTQLTGDHLVGRLFNSRVEWKLTYAVARRDEPDNRSATYVQNLATGEFSQATSFQNFAWFRFLTDQVHTGTLDWSFPISIRREADALLKFGGLHRIKDRRFDADLYAYSASSDPEFSDVLKLPPEHAFAPENVSGGPFSPIRFRRLDAVALPYESDDDLTSAYAMVDAPVGDAVRVVTGARAERWMLHLYPGSREAAGGDVVERDQWDVLPSANITYAVSDRTNIRLAAYRTVARPDPRELSEDFYVAVTGECGNQGNPGLRRTRILNADVRWEMYPGAGELFAISAFFKSFDEPIVEVVSLPQATTCLSKYFNALSARNVGGELEFRKDIGFLPLIPDGLGVQANLTVVRSRAELPADLGGLELPLQGQSAYVANAGMLYTSAGGRFSLSVLGNAFGDRITRYGATLFGDDGVIPIPSVEEEGRITIDAKLQARVTPRISLSLAGRNLTNAPQTFFQKSAIGRVRTGFVRPGIGISLGLGYGL